MTIIVEGLDRALVKFAELEGAVVSATKVGQAKAASTVEAKAKALAPVLTGALRDSIQTRTDAEGAEEVGTELEYSVYVEFGTVNMPAEPFLRPAADESQAGVTEAVGAALAAGIRSVVGL